MLPQRYIFSSKSQQSLPRFHLEISCCCYHKGTYFQANHNLRARILNARAVVVATTKVHIFKQITTHTTHTHLVSMLLLLPQRYIFSSKSQLILHDAHTAISCCCYHKGTYFQANHNNVYKLYSIVVVVVATTKVHIFKQITT